MSFSAANESCNVKMKKDVDIIDNKKSAVKMIFLFIGNPPLYKIDQAFISRFSFIERRSAAFVPRK